MSRQKTLVWFRNDLRLRDNAALRYAVDAGEVLPLFVFDEASASELCPGAASRCWLHHSLIALNASLDDRLVCRRGDSLSLIRELVAACDIDTVVWNRCYSPLSMAQDEILQQALSADGLDVRSFQGNLLWEPETIKTQQGTPYKVFTPFYNKGCLKAAAPAKPLAAPGSGLPYVAARPAGRPEDLQLLPERPWHKKFPALARVGEKAAGKRLARFLAGPLEDYVQGRDFPAADSVSGLSAHLHFGEISPRTVWHQSRAAASTAHRENQSGHFLRQLAWREFSAYLLYHFPHTARENLQRKFDDFPWRHDADALQAWQQGQTGYPIVDAGMRELWQTGFMHNRVRMIVASFLVKNLLIHWHAGADWFADCLFDADVANNSMGWQWVAGSGADAAPFFRIFNPVTQGQRFDPQGQYVRRFVPELSALPDKYLHDPGSAPAAVLQKAGVVPGETYPRPLVELKGSRQRALLAYERIRRG
ncbi:deoxyribodipyrimidine photo-lyase [Granulosicoccaceae sp. 1_MG-2023]|nr:deoxyribodipyrimidine photo-lyase [Granulosicoccaceae sp. 1_MG-2023]